MPLSRLQMAERDMIKNVLRSVLDFTYCVLGIASATTLGLNGGCLGHAWWLGVGVVIAK